MLVAAEVHPAAVHRREQLLRERVELVGVLLEVPGLGVADRAQGLAREGAADHGAVFGGADQGVLVARNRARFGRGDEPRADPRAVGSEGEGGGEPAAVEDPTGRDHRDLSTHRVDDLGNERHRGDGSGVASGLRALCDHEVAPGFDGSERVTDLPAHVGDEHAVLVAQLDRVAGDAQPGDEHRRALADQVLDVRHHLGGQRGEEVDTERLGRTLPHRTDLVDDLLGLHRRRTEAAEATRLRDRTDQAVVRHSAHPRQHHGVFDLEQVGQARAHRGVTPGSVGIAAR